MWLASKESIALLEVRGLKGLNAALKRSKRKSKR